MKTRTSSRRLLCEGWMDAEADGHAGSIWLPVLRYCKQGSKVWISEGGDYLPYSTSLSESTSAGAVTIVESIDEMDLEERKLPNGATVKLPKNGIWMVEGPCQRSDTKNANRRVYPRSIWERIIADSNSDVQKTIKARGMIGHLEHPADGRTDGKEGALLVVESRLLEDGVVWGKFELLDTPNGLILQEYTRKGVRWGISSRGNGTVDETGKVVDDSFVLETWDAVMRPSTPGAYLTANGAMKEQVLEGEQGEDEEPVDSASILEAFDGLLAQSLDESNPSEFLVETFDMLRSVLSNYKAAPTLMVDSLSQLAEKVRAAVAAIQSGSLSEAIDKIVDDLASPQDRTGAENRVLETLREQVIDLSVEGDSLRAKLEEAEAKIALIVADHDDALDRLTEAEEKTAAMQRQLDLADELLAESTETEVVPSVDRAVDAMIESNPRLRNFRDLLCESSTPDQAKRIAEQIASSVAHHGNHEPPRRVPRQALPIGKVSSGEVKPPAPPINESTSRGVSLAKHAIKRIGS